MHGWLLAWSCAGLIVGLATIQPPTEKEELAKLQGKWKCSGGTFNGKDLSEADAAALDMFFVFAKDRLTRSAKGQGKTTLSITLTTYKSPKEFDTVELDGPAQGKTGRGIYAVEGDILKVCFRDKLNGRPTRFEVLPGTDDTYLIFKRDEPMVFQTSLVTRIVGYVVSPVIRAALVEARKK